MFLVDFDRRSSCDVEGSMYRSKFLAKTLKLIPGEKTFGIYRLLPFWFLVGAVLEYSMINWTPGGKTNFC